VHAVRVRQSKVDRGSESQDVNVAVAETGCVRQLCSNSHAPLSLALSSACQPLFPRARPSLQLRLHSLQHRRNRSRCATYFLDYCAQSQQCTRLGAYER